MEFKTVIIVVLAASLAAYFIPTPAELQTHFKSGQDFYAAKDYVRAIDQYDRIIGAQSRFLESDSVRVSLLSNEVNVGVRSAAYYQKANAFRNLGKTDSSIAYYRIVEQRTDSPKLSALAQYQIYELYLNQKNHRKAVEEARRLIERYPLDERVPEAWYDIGWAFRDLGMIDSSNLAFQTLSKLYPSHPLDPKARYQLAQNYFDQEQWIKSIQAFNNLVEVYRPESFGTTEWENVELKAVRDRKLFEAQSAIDVDVSTLELVAKAQVKIGDAYRKLKLFDDAIAAYRTVISRFTLMPSVVEAAYNKMADYTAEAKGIEEGIRVYRQAIDENFSNKVLQAKLQYKIARTYQDNKLYAKAAREYLFYVQGYAPQAAQIKFTTEQAFFLGVSNFYNARDYKSTILYVDSMMVLFPTTEYFSKIVMYKGLSFAGLSRFEEAREQFKLVIQASPGSNEAVFAQVQLGKSYFDERKYDLAIASFERLLREDPAKLDLSEIHYLLGLSYYGLNQYDKAIDHLSRVEPTSTYYPFTFARITRAYTSQQNFEAASAFLAKAFLTAKRDTADFTPFIRLARAELSTAQQKFDQAVADFDTVASNTSLTENTRVQAVYGRGLVHYEMGKFKEAVADLTMCINSPVFQQVFSALVPQAKEKLAFSYVRLNNKKEGAELLTDLVARAESDIERSKYLAMLCEFYFRAADYQKAIDVGEQILSLKEQDESATIRAYITLSNSYGSLQKHDKAIGTLKEAIEKFPTNSFIEETFYQIGLIYYNGGDYKNASDAFKTFVAKYSSSKLLEDASYFYAFSLYHLGQADESIKLFRDFIRTFQNSKRVPDAQYQIAEAFFNTRRFEDAAREYRVVYQRHPQHELAPVAMFNEGWSYFQAQENGKTLATFGNLIERYPKTKVAADAQFTLGDYYYNEKSYDSALVAYQDFIKKFPDDPRVEEAKTLIHDLSQVEAYKAYEAAMAFFDAKNWQQAITALTEVMNKFPKTDIVYGCKANIASCYEQLGQRRKALQIFEEIVRDWKDIEAARSAVFFADLHKRWIEAGK